MKTKNPVQQKPWCRASVAEAVMQYSAAEAVEAVMQYSAAEAVVQNQYSRGSDAVQSSRSMDGRILSLLRGSVENM